MVICALKFNLPSNIIPNRFCFLLSSITVFSILIDIVAVWSPNTMRSDFSFFDINSLFWNHPASIFAPLARISTTFLVFLPRTIIKVKVSPIYDPYVGECLLERTLVLGHRLFEVGWLVTFLAAFVSPSLSTGSPFAARWTASERPTIASRWVSSRGLRHSRQAL